MDYILVTGGTGFIGSHLIERLLNENYNVILLKRSFSDTWRVKHLFDNFSKKLILVDIDLINLEEVFEKYSIEGIFHLATYYNKNPNFNEIKPMGESNIIFPLELINLAIKYKVNYFINTGTFMEYTLNNEQLVCSYDLNPKTFYATTKISFEEILKFFESNYPIHIATLKIYSPYGDKDDVKKIIPYLVNNTLNNKQVSINYPNNKLNLVFVDDIVSAFLKLREHILQFNEYESFDIANNISYSLSEIYNFIENFVEKNETISIKGVEIGNIPNINHNKKISWRPHIKIEDGLKKTIEYYKKK